MSHERQKRTAQDQHQVDSLCSEWHHGMYQDLQNSDIGFLVENDKGIKWFCSDCCPEIESAAKGENKALHKKLTVVAANKGAQDKPSSIGSMIKI